MRIGFIFCWAAWAMLCGGASVQALDIVAAGGAHATLVMPDHPLAAEEYAAQELQYHVSQSTGIDLPIIRETDASGHTGMIYLGATRAAKAAGLSAQALAPNGCLIKLVGDNLFILGRDTDGPLWSNQWTIHEIRTQMGTLFGVYEFLEKQLGVKWLWPGKAGEIIPKKQEIQIDQWDQTWAPPFIHTRVRDHTPMNIDFAVEGSGPFNLWSSASAAAEYRRDQGIWLRRQRFAMAVNLDARHSFQTYWSEFGKTHPEFFNLLPDGTRRSDPLAYAGSPAHVSMCVSQSGLWKAVVGKWQASRTAQDPYISAGENDNPGKCTCPQCLAWDEKDPAHPMLSVNRLARARTAFTEYDPQWFKQLGSVSDRYARFYLAVQHEAEQIDPNVVVKGFAYENYVAAPRYTKLNQRIVISFVPGFYYPWTSAKRTQFRRQWQGWADAGPSMMLRPNYFLDGHNLPVNFARHFGEDFQFAAAHNLMATDFDSLTGQWAAQGPNLYMLARKHVEPMRPVEDILQEYYQGFGPAADAVHAYFEYWQTINDAVTDERFDQATAQTQGNSWWGFIRLADTIFTPQAMAAGRRWLEAARHAAQGNATAEKRVAFLEAGLHNAELTLQAQRAFRDYRQKGDFEVFRKAIVQLDDYRRSIDRMDASNISFTYWAETLSGWDRKRIYH